MRLTNVAQMQLPQGTLHSLGVRVVSPALRSLPVSFDQRRHVGAGDRPGSWMAISLRIPAGIRRERLAKAWMSVVARHGALNTVFSRGPDGALVLQEHRVDATEWRRHPVAPGTAARDVLRSVFDEACTPFSRPSHLLALLAPDAGEDDQRPVAIIGSDHAHVDMWSLLILARDLREALDSDGLAEPAASFADHSAALERMPPAPAAVIDRWHEILADGEGRMPRFPLPLGDLAQPRPEVVEVRDVLDGPQLARFEGVAAEHGVRVTALALSVLTTVTRDLAGRPLRAVFPVHSRHESRWYDSVGWFITNSVIDCVDPDPAACARAVKEALVLGSQPLAPIFAPYGGMPETPGMFAVSWLDSRRLPPAPGDMSVQYVSAVISTDGVMVWFIVNDEGLHLRCRYPDTQEARASVGRWLDEVEDGLRAAADQET
ncbi:condensation domain-containing protein [Microbacterium hydrocarbonoxydans]|uniref:condensation domain-containing protein n=1 Tax=Microbacterium hydrocarbonoxydans TaxID=273678 RepID=UPI0007BADEDC|nr:condensation domain-containing protein [Microbacterium hydrocarbonoxydans]GAT71797.1 arthrofactin synthetase/syringopeptin synthetase C-related non-ribosomal peptide synthetase module [Microbacterium sp. HM58-2]